MPKNGKRCASYCAPRLAHIAPKSLKQKLWFRALMSSRHVRRKESAGNKVRSRESNVSFVDEKEIFDHGKYTRFSERQCTENSQDLISTSCSPTIEQFADPTSLTDQSDDISDFYLQDTDPLEIMDDIDMEESSSAKIANLRKRSNQHSCPLDLQQLESSDSDGDVLPIDQIMHLSGRQLKEDFPKPTSSADNSFDSINDDLEAVLAGKDISSPSNVDEPVEVIKLEVNKGQRSSRKEKMDKIFTVKIPERNQIILILEHPSEVVIKGISSLKVISGSVTTYGYHLDNSKPSISLFSLKKCGYINVSTRAPELRTLRSSKKNITSELKAITGVYFTHTKSVINHLSVVLLLQPAKILTARAEYALTHIGEKRLSLLMRQPDDINACGLSVSVASASTKLACNANGEWFRLANIIQDAFALAGDDESLMPRIVVCGGKNSGKSTLLRYLINTILNKCSNCYHLEADIGQTEFTPPGCISLTKVDKPLLGPPFTHAKNPEKMYFVGAPSVKSPDDYLYGLTAAFEYYSQQSHKAPLFVNTMGWTKDLGMLLLMDILHIVQPTHVIQINFEDSRRGQNLRSLTPEFVCGTNGWRFPNSDKKLQQYHLIELSSISHTGHSSLLFTSAETRNLQILSYLGQLQAANALEVLPINSFYPYVLPWSAVAIYIYHHIVSQKQILFALNAVWVALCRIPNPKVLEGEDNEMPKMLANIDNHECLGFGIIRGIDATEKKFYIITPEPLTKLQNVNALVRGSVNLPEILLTSQDGERLPYCAKEEKQKCS